METSQITIESTTLAGTGGKSGSVLVGGFDDEEPEDDSLECEVARESKDLDTRSKNKLCFTLLIYSYRLPSH